MILREDAEARAEFLAALQRHLGWDQTDESSRVEMLQGILHSIDDDRVPGAVIPIRLADRMMFGAVADDTAEWRKLSPLLMAAIGMTLTTFDGQTHPPDDGELESLIEQHGLVFARFAAPKDDRAANRAAIEALLRLIRQLGEAPQGLRDTPRSAAEILHHFDLALRAGSRDVAEAELQELASRRAVDALNLHFLTTRWHATFGQWRRLRDEPWFPELCRTRRPPRVGALLVEAIYEADLGGDGTTVEEIRQRFEERVVSLAGSLFVLSPAIDSAPIATTYLLDALERSDAPRLEELRSVDTASWTGGVRDRYEALLAMVPPSVEETAATTDVYADIERLLAGERPLTHQDARAVTAQLGDDDSLKARRLLMEIVQQLTAGPDEVPVSAAPTLDEVPVAEESPVPGNWIEWFELLPQFGFDEARSIAEQAAFEWPIATQLRSPDDVDLFVRAMTDAAGVQPTRFSHALPHLVDWLAQDEHWPNEDFAVLYDEILTLFFILERRNTDALRAALTVLDALLEVGPAPEVYERLLGDLGELLPSVASDRSLDVFLDLGELLLTYPCPEESARTTLWAGMLEQFWRFSGRLSRAQVTLLNSQATAFGTPAEFKSVAADESASDDERSWSGVIGLYTLRAPVALKVRETLRSVLPGAEVELSHAKGATDALRGLVARADVMAIDWTAAKHSATLFIRQQLGDLDPTWVRGGASSITSELLAAVAADAKARA